MIARVVHLISDLGRGGAQSQLLLLASNDSNDNYIFTLSPGGEMYPLYCQAGVKFIFSNSDNLLVRILHLVLELHRLKPDFIVGWMYHSSALSALISTILPRVKVIWNIRHSLSSIKNESRNTKLSIYLCLLLSRIPSVVIFNSNTAKSQHLGFGFPRAKSCVIHNGTDVQRFVPSSTHRNNFRDFLAIKDSVPLIGHIARYHPMKNQKGLLDILYSLSKSIYEFHCVFIGTGVTSAELRQYSAELGLAQRVTFMESVNNIHHFLPALDVLVLPSLWGEGCPNVVAEAQACNVPVIAYDIGDLSFLITNNHHLIAPGSSISFQSALSEFISDHVASRPIRYPLREHIVTNFSLQSMIDSYRQLFRK